MKYLNFKNINYYFNNYKKRQTHHNLSCLYTELDPLILDVTKNISKSFRNKKPTDFEDLQQEVRLEIFNVLEKICQISFSGEQLAKILVKVIIYSFIDHYHKYKKESYVLIRDADTQSDNFFPFINIDYIDGENVEKDIEVKGVRRAIVFTNSTQEKVYYINSLEKKIREKILTYNRYKDNESLVLFCFDSLFNSRDISPKIIQQGWGVSNPKFWLDYTEVLLRMAIYNELNDRTHVSPNSTFATQKNFGYTSPMGQR